MFRTLVAVVLVSVAALGAANVAAQPIDRVQLIVPATTDGDTSVAIEITLPRHVAAVDGRLLIDTSAADVIGLAPVGGGSTFQPQEISGGAAFGAYGLAPSRGLVKLRIVLAPHEAGQLEFRVVIDAAADVSGRRIAINQPKALSSLRVGAGNIHLPAPAGRSPHVAPRQAGKLRDLVVDGQLSKKDLDVVRAGWEFARANDQACGAGINADADANGDGCVDIVDIQAVVAAQGQRIGARVASSEPAGDGLAARFTASVGAPLLPAANAFGAPAVTFTVDSTSDRADANNGDGVCADSQGRCTLRAAITESNWSSGDNRIEFNLSGNAPVPIQFGSDPVSIIQDRSGSLVIDGYSQPGSRINTASVGSNAVPGIELRGTGSSPRGNAFRITSAGNVIRGFLINNFYRPIMMDGPDAHNNLIVGNLIGFTSSGAVHSYRGNHAVRLNVGAHDNIVGAPALADRNVIGNFTHAIDLYGPGTDSNVAQNNALCMTPSGMGLASCSTAIDHNFGPKNNLHGGSGPGQRNVIGGTTLNGIEISHGWDPAKRDTSTKWQNNGNRVIGNWIGFRGDGSYSASFRSGQNSPNSNDANGVNAYDGSNFNVIEGNWIGSVWDGVNTMSPNSTGNIIRNNVIGESPLGQAAPMGRNGIHVRNNTKTVFVEGNIIRNAGVYGIGLTQPDVLWVRVSRNIITDMSGPAIYLASGGGGTGANNLTPAPVITTATTVQVGGTGLSGATVEVYRASRSAGLSGLPVAYLGSAVVADNGSWSLPVILQTGERATALQITPSNNTSALGVNVAATFAQPPSAPVANFSWSQQLGSLAIDFSDTSTGVVSQRSWNFGDGSTGDQSTVTHTYAAAGNYSVTLTVSNGGGSNSKTKQINVQTPPPPPPGGTIAADGFGRSLSGSWGSADTGGAYTVLGSSSNFSVANGVGSIMLNKGGANRAALLDGVAATDVDLIVRVRADKAPAGAPYYAYLVARRNGKDSYRPKLIMNANGTVSVHAGVVTNNSESSLGPAVVVSGLSQAPNTFIWLRAQVSGTNPTTIKVKAWADGQSEPAGWQFSVTNSSAAVQVAGSVGLRAYLGGSVSNAPVVMGFDDFEVRWTP